MPCCGQAGSHSRTRAPKGNSDSPTLTGSLAEPQPWDGAAPGVGKRIGCFVGEEERRMGPGRIRGQSAAGGWGSRRSRAGVRGRPVSAGRSLGCRGGLAPRAGGGSRRGHRGRYLALRAAGRAEGRRVLAPGPAPPPRSSSYRSEPSATGALSTKRHFRAAP
jgi:hypothetical protein